MIIVIFIKLLVINIVASSIFGDSISLIISLCLWKLESFNLFLFVGVREKSATSELEINPEQNNKKTHDNNGGSIL